MVTVERLKAVLRYDPETGLFHTLAGGHGQDLGQVAGSIYSTGYCVITIDWKRYLAHRLAWLYVHGRWPRIHLDHIDGNRCNNRIENLREATPSQNMHNSKAYITSTTGLKGVKKYRRRFQARIKVNGKEIYLGTFDSAEEAHRAYCTAARNEYGDFARFH